MFQDMLLAKVRPSTVVFNNLISGLSRSGHAHRAFKYFNDVGYSFTSFYLDSTCQLQNPGKKKVSVLVRCPCVSVLGERKGVLLRELLISGVSLESCSFQGCP